MNVHGRNCFEKLQAEAVKRRRERLLRKIKGKNIPLPFSNQPSKIAEMRFHFPETLRPLTKTQRLENLPFCPTLLPAQRPLKGHFFHFLVTELNWLLYTQLIRIEFLVKIYGGRIIPYEDEFIQNDMNKCIVLFFGSDKKIAQRFYNEHRLPIYSHDIIRQSIVKGLLDKKLLCRNIVTF